MKTELMLVEGVSDVLLISYYLQNVYEWKHEAGNDLGITPFDDMVHFAQPIDYPSSDGLRTDKLTQPLPTLIYHIETNEFEETEYTEKYLML